MDVLIKLKGGGSFIIKKNSLYMCVCVCVHGLVLKLMLLETCLLNIHIYINLELKLYSAFYNILNNTTVRASKLSINFLSFFVT